MSVARVHGLEWASPLAEGDMAAVTEDVLLESGVVLAAGQRGRIFGVTEGAVGFEWPAGGGGLHCVALAVGQVRAV